MTSATTYYLLRHIPALKKKSHSARSGKVPILSAERQPSARYLSSLICTAQSWSGTHRPRLLRLRPRPPPRRPRYYYCFYFYLPLLMLLPLLLYDEGYWYYLSHNEPKHISNLSSVCDSCPDKKRNLFISLPTIIFDGILACLVTLRFLCCNLLTCR